MSEHAGVKYDLQQLLYVTHAGNGARAAAFKCALKKAQAAAGVNDTPNVKIQIDRVSGASTVAATVPNTSMQALVSGIGYGLTVFSGIGSITFGTGAPTSAEEDPNAIAIYYSTTSTQAAQR